jgi:hypothetical protein
MIDTFLLNANSKTVRSRQQRSSLIWLVWFLFVLGFAGVMGLLMIRSGPSISLIAWLVYFIGIALIFIEPRYGVYLILFWGFMGDGVLTPWFPFTKNFSSFESLLYIHDAVIINPLETYILATAVSWLGRGVMRRQVSFYAGPLFLPALVFTGFIAFGFIYGIGTGGDLRIAIWEGRAIFYLLLMLILVSNLITKREHVSHLAWFIMISLFIEGLSGIYYYFVELGGDLSQVESISEHSAAIHMNTFFIFVIAVWLFKGSQSKRFILPLMVPVVAFTYLATQRRAAFLTLGIALIFVAIILFKENRRWFAFIMPPMILIAIAYVSIFWNSNGTLGMPAQAVKAIVAPEQASIADRRSDIYRDLEDFNSSFTIHAKPLTGVGFGQKFYRVVSLPDISFFEFWEYMTHNSIMWIWMKAGVGGFLSMLFLVGYSIALGVHVLWKMPGGDLSAVTMLSILYLIMHFLFAYVDISWGIENMIYVGTAMGLINSMERIVERPVAGPIKRWPWQRISSKPPGLKPL